ncbi:hypothetical protein LTR37_005176 [Vermiconidia calcicola]|uniref:Uncharacterized protein n=1 Tax=Vermiconidia calcicola TaxID=1690605 RepID=A0ACC3NLD5_9PEZI|nr:hypothetical protein LTR37_005176 [Vermiconidia calcicola]
MDFRLQEQDATDTKHEISTQPTDYQSPGQVSTGKANIPSNRTDIIVNIMTVMGESSKLASTQSTIFSCGQAISSKVIISATVKQIVEGQGVMVLPTDILSTQTEAIGGQQTALGTVTVDIKTEKIDRPIARATATTGPTIQTELTGGQSIQTGLITGLTTRIDLTTGPTIQAEATIDPTGHKAITGHLSILIHRTIGLEIVRTAHTTGQIVHTARTSHPVSS